MTNYVENASGLNGTVGWFMNLASSFADETYAGSPGRVALVAEGAAGAENPLLDAVASGFPTGVPLTAQALWTASHDARLLVVWLNAQQGEISRVLVPVAATPQSSRTPRGIPSRLFRSSGRVVAPAGSASARVRLEAYGAPPGAASYLAMTRPMLGDQGVCWAPGPHAQNPDLNLMSWPGGLEPRSDSWSATPTGVRVGFQTDSRIPITTQVATEPWVLASFSMALDLGQRDDLDTFWRSTKGVPFWYVRPDTHQLCRAWWTEDGDPSDNGMGRSRRTEVGLLLEPT